MIRLALVFDSSRPGQALARAIAVLGLVLLFVLSLVPHNVPLRSGLIPGPAEHFFAYLAVGAALAYAFPRHIGVWIALLVGSAAFLELLQTLVDRHPRFIDAAGGMLGAVSGCALIWLLQVLQEKPE